MDINLKKPLVYVTRDIERALGMEPKNGYFVISNNTEYGREVQKKYPDSVWLIQDTKNKILDTFDILTLPAVTKTISDYDDRLLVFQNTPRIERLAKDKGWKLLNPSAELSKKVEEKISQVEWLGPLSSLLPHHHILPLKTINYKLKTSPFVLQFNHAHTGSGTHIIKDEKELEDLRVKFPEREARITDLIDGPVFTVNAVVSGEEVLVGNISYQITGLPPFTDNPFATVGNDWALPHMILSEGERKSIKEIARTIGARLEKDGWRGLFGIDVIQDSKTRKIYLLEINARQPASTTFESQLQKRVDPSGLSTFGAHISSLLGLAPSASSLVPLSSGAQIVLRHTNILKNVSVSELRKDLETAGFTIITYDDPSHGKELLRIQTKDSLMKAHGIFSDLGEKVRAIIMKQ